MPQIFLTVNVLHFIGCSLHVVCTHSLSQYDVKYCNFAFARTVAPLEYSYCHTVV